MIKTFTGKNGTLYIDKTNKKIVKNGLAKGTRYAAYNNQSCTDFFMWVSSDDIQRWITE
jgi:hypothetical protein